MIDAFAISADIRDAFDRAVIEFIAWDDDGGEEPTVSVHSRPTLIGAIAGLAESYTDTMPASLFWRMVNYANRSLERRREASELSKDGSYATGAWCLLNWIQDNKDRIETPDGVSALAHPL
jgi:hypothetical protein